MQLIGVNSIDAVHLCIYVNVCSFYLGRSNAEKATVQPLKDSSTPKWVISYPETNQLNIWV